MGLIVVSFGILNLRGRRRDNLEVLRDEAFGPRILGLC